MPEAVSLSALNNSIADALHNTFSKAIWVTAEINQLNENRSGHCYLELIEKHAKSENIQAKARGTIWINKYRYLKAFFEQSTGQIFTDGIKILIKVEVSYHVLFGLSLNIIDIDPSYTLGDLARRRKEIIAQLEATGMMHMNQELMLPAVIKRIAVVSGSGTAGFGDFAKQIAENRYGYAIDISLFEAYMQGKQTEQSVIDALDKINHHPDAFDAVLIIRGGGAKNDLTAFDNLAIASHVMQFPLPVITGIGHERDESVTDLVAHTKVKTPTAAAEFIIHHNASFEEQADMFFSEILEKSRDLVIDHNLLMQQISLKLAENTRTRIHSDNKKIQTLSAKTAYRTSTYIERKQQHLKRCMYRLSMRAPAKLQQKEQALNNLTHWLGNAPYSMLRHKMQIMEQHSQLLRMADPVQVLKRGYSITTLLGKAIKNANEVTDGSLIKTRFSQGEILSKVEKKQRIK